MSEEHNDGTWSGLMKTIVGTVGTLVTAGGAYVGSMFFGGGDAPAETAAPVQTQAPAPVINITTNNTQQQQASGGTKVIERVVEKPAPTPAPEKKKDSFTEEEPLW